jgi:hypothetical protein
MSVRKKMNSVGYLVGHCGGVISEQNMQRMRKQLTMADSAAEVSQLEAQDKELEKREKNKAMRRPQQQQQSLKRKVVTLLS